MGIGRHDGVRLHDGYLRLMTNLTARKEIDASIVSDAKQPRCQRAVLIKGVELSIGLEERVLNHVLAVQHRSGHTRTVTVQAGPQVGDGFEERQVTRLEGARSVNANRIIHIDLLRVPWVFGYGPDLTL